MQSENLGVFKVDGEKYPIKQNVYNFVKSYLHEKEYVKWVYSDEPNIKIGIKSDVMKETKTVCRKIKEMLNGTEIGHQVVRKLDLESI